MRIERHYTTDDGSPREEVAYRTTACEIRNPDGSAVFAQKDVEVPAGWSQVACDVLAQKYFRKAGIAAQRKPVPEADVPEWLWRSAPDPEAEESADPADDKPSQGERSAKEVFHRLAGTWTYWGWKAGYFDSESDARAFYDELFAMLALQVAAPNSPQWFNTGLHWAYGIDGPAQGHYHVDFESGALKEAESAYEHPQPHACFIQSIRDDLVNEGGIMDLWVREARLFKYGSGTGTNFSNLRGEGEPLSGGGKSSGLMSFLKIGDRAAGAIKSGGTTRRAAKMVIVDVDHPDIEDFVSWKVVEEQKVAALVSGSQLLHKHLNAVVEACQAGSGTRPVRAQVQPRAQRCRPRGAEGARAGDLHLPRDPLGRAGLHRDRLPHLRHRLAVGGLSHRIGPELQQLDPRDRCLPAAGRDRRAVGPDPPHRRQGSEDHRSAGAVGPDRGGRLGVGRSRHPVRQHHQCLAHVPGRGADQRVQPLLRIHVPRRHGLQPRLAQPDHLPAQGRQLRHRELRARRPALDRRPRDRGGDGAVPVAGDCAALLSLPDAGPRLRQSGRAAHVTRAFLRQHRGPGALRRHQRAHDRHRLRSLGGNGRRAWRLPRVRRQPGRHAAGDTQPPRRRPRRERALRGPRHPAGAARSRQPARPPRSARPRRAPGTAR